MRIVAADAFLYRLPLVEPLALPSGTHTERRGVLLRLTADDGAEGWGEAAPLPGYSPDTLDDVLAELPAVLRVYRERTAVVTRRGGSVEGPGVRRPAGRGERPFPPSLRTAEAQAQDDLLARVQGETLAQVALRAVVGPRPSAPAETVQLNALLTAPDPERTAQVRAAGYLAVKLKVGRQSPEADAEAVRRLAEALPGVALRLDANRAWSFAQAVRFADAIGDTPVEYVEEPLSDWRRLPDIGARLPYALDETLRDLTGRHRRLVRDAAAFVVKPTVGAVGAGSVPGLRRHAPATPVVVSSVFESGVGMRHLVALAAALGETPAGLDTYRQLAGDVLARPLPISGPTVTVADVLAPNSVRLDRLHNLPL